MYPFQVHCCGDVLFKYPFERYCSGDILFEYLSLIHCSGSVLFAYWFQVRCSAGLLSKYWHRAHCSAVAQFLSGGQALEPIEGLQTLERPLFFIHHQCQISNENPERRRSQGHHPADQGPGDAALRQAQTIEGRAGARRDAQGLEDEKLALSGSEQHRQTPRLAVRAGPDAGWEWVGV